MTYLQKSGLRQCIKAIATTFSNFGFLQPSLYFLRKRFITLAEIMIVLTIISMVGGVMAVGLRQIIRDQRFRTEVSQVVNTLQLAQQIMIILNTDVHVIFKSTPKGFTYQITLDDKLNDRWHKELTKLKPPLQEIHAINFVDVLSTNSSSSSIDIKFLSGGSTMSQGTLRLGIAPPGVPDTQEAFICLPGYPHFITSTPKENADTACIISDQKKFNQSVTQATVNEINEKERAHKEIKDEDEDGDKKNKDPKPDAKDSKKNDSSSKKS